MKRYDRLTPRQHQFLVTLLGHPEMDLLKVAGEVKLHPSVLMAWLGEPLFAARLEAALAIQPRMLAQREMLGRIKAGKPIAFAGQATPRTRRPPPPRARPAEPAPDDRPAEDAAPEPLTPEQFAELMRQARREPHV